VNRLRKIFIAIMAILTITMAAGMTSASGIDTLKIGGTTTGTNGQDVDVTIDASGMSNVGSLQLNLVYDKNVITTSLATPGSITSGGLFAPNYGVGKVGLGWISTTGMSGTGTLVTIRFHVVGNPGDTSPLDIQLVDITDPSSGAVTTRPTITSGVFTVGGVNKITPTITWSNPADITDGTPLSGTQLNAVASDAGTPVAGIFVYTPPSGTVLAIGNGQTLHVVFTPTDTTKYNSASKDVTINVKPTQTNGGTVKGKVFNDLDKDKKLDNRESGIADVVVTLKGDDKKTKKISLKVKTDVNGNYIFQGLIDGKYKLHVETKHGWDYTTSTSYKVTMKHGNTVTQNFGEKKQNKKHGEHDD
jgi:hypothetical protein